jgi:hypothetical protein
LGPRFYNRLQVTLTEKTFHGLDLIAGYAWAHSLDNAASNRTGFPQDNRTISWKSMKRRSQNSFRPNFHNICSLLFR